MLKSNHAHVEAAGGDDIKNRDYCTKEDTRVSDALSLQSGTFISGEQGRRTDLEFYRDSIRYGCSDANLLIRHLPQVARYPHLISMVRSAFGDPGYGVKEIIVIGGPSGCGKTRYAWETWPDLFPMPLQGGQELWFGDKNSGFDGQETVLFDEFHGEMSRKNLMLICDRYPITVPLKGAFANWNCKRVVFTSYERPEAWYNWGDTHQAWESFERRITERFNIRNGERIADVREAPLFNRMEDIEEHPFWNE